MMKKISRRVFVGAGSVAGAILAAIKGFAGTENPSQSPEEPGVSVYRDSRVKGFPTVADMVASPTLSVGDIVETLGYYSVGDGGDNLYQIVVAGTGTDDGGSFIDLSTHQAKGLFRGNNYNIIQFGADPTATRDSSKAIQSAIDSGETARAVLIPEGMFKITKTIYLNRRGLHLRGVGDWTSRIVFINPAGGTAIAAAPGTTDPADPSTYSGPAITYCSLKHFSIVSNNAATDCSVGVEFTGFSYSEFDISVRSKRARAYLYHGQGNSGSSPYYNRIRANALIGGGALDQTAFKLSLGTFANPSFLGGKGVNGNFFGPVGRVAAVGIVADVNAGNGNFFTHICAETVSKCYYRFNDNPLLPNASGRVTGATQATLVDRSKVGAPAAGPAWTDGYWTGGTVVVKSASLVSNHPNKIQYRSVSGSKADTLTVNPPWARQPDEGDTYEVHLPKAIGNVVHNNRVEGSSGTDFIQVMPGALKHQAENNYVSSLGSGLFVKDYSGDNANQWFSERRVAFTERIINDDLRDGSNYIDVYPRVSGFGGVRLQRAFVVDWLHVILTGHSHGDDITVSLSVGHPTLGTGKPFMEVVVPDGSTQGCAIAGPTDRYPMEGANDAVFIKVITGSHWKQLGSFPSPGVQITWAATLV